MAERALSTWAQIAAVGATLTAACVVLLINNRWGAYGAGASIAPPVLGWPIFFVLWRRSSIAAKAEVEAAQQAALVANLTRCSTCRRLFPEDELEPIGESLGLSVSDFQCSDCGGIVPSGPPRPEP